jgi:hypothetical protein
MLSNDKTLWIIVGHPPRAADDCKADYAAKRLVARNGVANARAAAVPTMR